MQVQRARLLASGAVSLALRTHADGRLQLDGVAPEWWATAARAKLATEAKPVQAALELLAVATLVLLAVAGSGQPVAGP